MMAGALLALWLGLGLATSSQAAHPPLRSLQAIHVLSNAEAEEALPVDFEATVTYYRPGNVDMFVQDGDSAIYVETTEHETVRTGDRVRVEGVTRASFRPEIKASQLTYLHRGTLPTPVRASFRQLIRAELDCRRVTVRAIVQGAHTVTDSGQKSTYLQLRMDGGSVDAEVFGSVSTSLSSLLDAEVEVTGAVAGKFDTKMQMAGVLIQVPSLDDLHVVKRAGRPSASLPLTRMDEILHAMDVQDRTQRVRVEGSVTYYHPGRAVVIQDGKKSLWVRTEDEEPLEVGEWVSASGFPDVQNGSVVLTSAEIVPSGKLAPVAPYQGTAEDLMHGSHATDLISVQGRVLMAIREARQDEYVLISGAHLFSAVYRHPERGLDVSLPEMRQVAVGTIVRVTGICMMDRADFFQGPVSFEVMLRTPDDVTELERPTLLNVRNLVRVVLVLLLILLTLGIRAWVTERKLRNRATQLVKVEKMRSEILGRINRVHPLSEVMEQITQLVLLALPACECWCSMENGDLIGKRAGESATRRLVENVISSRSGAPYGLLWAAFAGGSKPSANEAGVLSTAAELATIAMETSRIHSDLVMRSEFDLLTGVHNRFALEKRLYAAMENRTQGEEVKAVIYLDLDDFKGVNDTYGHHIGDLYLREIALRLKSQVRPMDLLARLGGDEFAVVVSGARSREDVEEIANRLKSCFDRRFVMEGCELHGSASFGIAYCPDDGMTKEELLMAADRAMYARKRARRMARPTYN